MKLSLVRSPLLVNVSWLCPIDPWVPELAKNHRVDRGSYRVHAHIALLLTGLNPRRVFFPYGHVKVPETHQFPEPMMQTLLGAAIVERKVQRWTGATAALFTAVCVCVVVAQAVNRDTASSRLIGCSEERLDRPTVLTGDHSSLCCRSGQHNSHLDYFKPWIWQSVNGKTAKCIIYNVNSVQ